MAILIAQMLFLALFIGALLLAAYVVFVLPLRLFEFRNPEWAMLFVACATIATWLILSYFHVRGPGILITSPHKFLAGIAICHALLWSVIEDIWS